MLDDIAAIIYDVATKIENPTMSVMQLRFEARRLRIVANEARKMQEAADEQVSLAFAASQANASDNIVRFPGKSRGTA